MTWMDVTAADMLEAFECAHRPLKSAELAIHLRFAKVSPPYSKLHCVFDGARSYRRFMALLLELRTTHQVVKLPHEGARAGAQYARCHGKLAARQMQRLAVELRLSRATCPLRRARLEQLLTGLQSEAA